MKILYIGNHGKYDVGVFEVAQIIGNPTEAQIAEHVDGNIDSYQIAVVIDVEVSGGMVTPPFGVTNGVVIDNNGESPEVRPKNEAELLVDTKEILIHELKQRTREFIEGVCDDERQRSLSLMYNNMSTTDKGRAKLYFDWHKGMLAKHYATEGAIAAAASTEDAQAALETGISELVALTATAPLAETVLSSYIH